ncbi:MAG: FKBP-type peptidyl-prolyl cis-trans isomerase N-terminal domain-containing protein, partial [Bacteroidia bacterium]
MKKISIILAVVIFSVMNIVQAQVSKGFQDSLSYAIGVSIGKNFAKDLNPAGIKVDEALFLKGMREYMAPAYSEDQINQVFQQFQGMMQKQQAEAQKQQMELAKKEGEANGKIGREFLEKNKNEAGVKTTSSGLQYKVLTAVDKGVQP